MTADGEPAGERLGELAVNAVEIDAPKARGKRRMKQLAGIYEADRIELERAILAGRDEPDALARIAAEALSSAIIGARRRRAAGHSDADMLRIAAQWMRASGLKPPPVQPAEPPSPYEMLLNNVTEADDAEGAG